MSFLPDVVDGKLMSDPLGDENSLHQIVAMLPAGKKALVKKLMSEGHTIRKALEVVGVMICER